MLKNKEVVKTLVESLGYKILAYRNEKISILKRICQYEGQRQDSWLKKRSLVGVNAMHKWGPVYKLTRATTSEGANSPSLRVHRPCVLAGSYSLEQVAHTVRHTLRNYSQGLVAGRIPL